MLPRNGAVLVTISGNTEVALELAYGKRLKEIGEAELEKAEKAISGMFYEQF